MTSGAAGWEGRNEVKSDHAVELNSHLLGSVTGENAEAICNMV